MTESRLNDHFRTMKDKINKFDSLLDEIVADENWKWVWEEMSNGMQENWNKAMTLLEEIKVEDE
jgi:hypothetical protein